MADPDPPLPDPDSRNVLEPDCARCPALVESRERISWGNGSLDADVMVVGEAPGYGNPDADRWRGGNWTGLAYTSRHSGRAVRGLFDGLGYGPDDLYVTNAVKCFPEDADVDQATHREPTADERDACADHLVAELDAVDPAVVVATGKHATRALLDREDVAREGFLDRVLDPVDCPGLGVTVVPALHPSYQAVWLARLDYDREAYVDDLGALLDRLTAADR